MSLMLIPACVSVDMSLMWIPACVSVDMSLMLIPACVSVDMSLVMGLSCPCMLPSLSQVPNQKPAGCQFQMRAGVCIHQDSVRTKNMFWLGIQCWLDFFPSLSKQNKSNIFFLLSRFLEMTTSLRTWVIEFVNLASLHVKQNIRFEEIFKVSRAVEMN